jgi:uncharacterized protein YbbK (DUF523 family)
MLCDFKDKSVFNSLNLEGIEDWWYFSLELHINDCTDDLNREERTCDICPFLEVRGLAVPEKALRVVARHDLKTLALSMNK